MSESSQSQLDKATTMPVPKKESFMGLDFGEENEVVTDTNPASPEAHYTNHQEVPDAFNEVRTEMMIENGGTPPTEEAVLAEIADREIAASLGEPISPEPQEIIPEQPVDDHADILREVEAAVAAGLDGQVTGTSSTQQSVEESVATSSETSGVVAEGPLTLRVESTPPRNAETFAKNMEDLVAHGQQTENDFVTQPESAPAAPSETPEPPLREEKPVLQETFDTHEVVQIDEPTSEHIDHLPNTLVPEVPPTTTKEHADVHEVFDTEGEGTPSVDHLPGGAIETQDAEVETLAQELERRKAAEQASVNEPLVASGEETKGASEQLQKVIAAMEAFEAVSPNHETREINQVQAYAPWHEAAKQAYDMAQTDEERERIFAVSPEVLQSLWKHDLTDEAKHVNETPEVMSEMAEQTTDSLTDSVSDAQERAPEMLEQASEEVEEERTVSVTSLLGGEERNALHETATDDDLDALAEFDSMIENGAPADDEVEETPSSTQEESESPDAETVETPSETPEDEEPENNIDETISTEAPAEEGEVAEEIEGQAESEENTEPTEERSPVSPDTVSEDVYGAFAEKLNITKDELSNWEQFENFASLTREQQLLTLQNLEQITLSRVQDEALDAQGAAFKEKVQASTSKAGQMWAAMKGGFFKNRDIAELEKRGAEKLLSGGLSEHADVLDELVKGMRENDPKVLERDGVLQINFANPLENMFPNEEAREGLDRFNEAASQFARIPAEWGYDTATKKQRFQFHEAAENYAREKQELFDLSVATHGVAPTYEAMAEIETTIATQRFLQTNPEAATELENIKDQNVWLAGVKDIASKERGLYFALGAAGRSIASGMLGWAAAPLVAAGIGGLRGYNRAGTDIEQQDKDMRRGKDATVGEGTEANLVNASGEAGLSHKLDHLVSKLNTENERIAKARLVGDTPDTRLRDKLAHSLKVRIDFTEQKLSEGKVAFGDASDRAHSVYDLYSSLAHAKGLYGTQEMSLAGEGGASELESRLDALLSSKHAAIEENRKAYKKAQLRKGVAMGAGWGLFGATVAHAAEIAQDMSNEATLSSIPTIEELRETGMEQETLKNAFPETKEPEAIELPDGELGEENRTIEPETPLEQLSVPPAVETVPESATPLELPNLVQEVKSGDSVWKEVERIAENIPGYDTMSEGQQTYVVDALKDKITALDAEQLKEIGIRSGNAGELYVGDTIDYGKVFDQNSINDALRGAQDLSAEDVSTIEANNDKIEYWKGYHQGEPLDDATLEQILNSETLKAEDIPDPEEVAQAELENKLVDQHLMTHPGEELTSETIESVTNPENIETPVAEETVTHAETVVQGDPTPEQITIAHKRAEAAFTEDVDHIYGTKTKDGHFIVRGTDSNDWADLRERNVADILEKKEFLTGVSSTEGTESVGIDSREAVVKTQRYIGVLQEETGIIPEEGETLGHYYDRVHHENELRIVMGGNTEQTTSPVIEEINAETETVAVHTNPEPETLPEESVEQPGEVEKKVVRMKEYAEDRVERKAAGIVRGAERTVDKTVQREINEFLDDFAKTITG